MKILRPYIVVFLLFFVFKSNAQNLINDNRFNMMTTGDCHGPPWATQFLQYWYTSSGTPNLFIRGCNHEFDNTTAWYRDIEPNSFLGLGGSMLEIGYMGSESIATQLKDTVETGRYYYFEIKARNQGLSNSIDDQIHCVTDPPKSIDIYFSNREIPPEEYDGTPPDLGEKVLSFTDENIMDTVRTNDWTQFKTCVEGRDFWQYMAVSLPQTQFTTELPCVIDTTSNWLFNTYNYDIDDVYFIAYPKAQTYDMLLCEEDKKIEFDATDLFEHPLLLENAEIVWQDGSTDLQYTFTEAGEYQMDIIVECGTIPLKFNITEKRCTPVVFVPTGFSPNYDGINDELFPYFKTDFQVQNYEFRIFDRWGNIFYRSSVKDGFTGWDGKVNGKEAMVGTYVWVLTFDLLEPNGEWKSYQLSGDTLLMR